MVDPQHEPIIEALKGLGVRRRPPLRFLPRGHLLNRLIGRMQARLVRPLNPPSSDASRA
jgi:hypothetical protein